MESLDFVDPIGALQINPIYTQEVAPSELSVVVRNAVTPWNFHVTDYCSSKMLETLEISMTEWYDAYEKTNQDISNDLELGGFYAVKYITEDKPVRWLRCEIVKPFKKDLPSITAKLVDNGAFYHTVTENFLRLRKPYCRIPIQAIEATIHASDGTKTHSRQLGLEECRKFYEMVEGKHFYAFLLNSGESLRQRESLRLILVDTSQTLDRYIHEEFNLKLDTTS